MADLLFALFAVLLVASSVVIHEMGHWLVLRRIGVPVTGVSIGAGPALFRISRVTVRVLPVLVSLHFDQTDWRQARPTGRAYAALAGPAASLGYGAILAGAGHLEGSPGLLSLAALNLALATINLLPIPPLDGWHALCAAMEVWTTKPLPQAYLDRAGRLGNAFIYGVGSLLLYQVLTRPPYGGG